MILEIISTKVDNDYTTTAVASTVSAAEYKADGQIKTAEAGEGKTLVLVIDGIQKDLKAGSTYEVKENYEIVAVKVYRVGGPSAAPWSGAKEEEKTSYYFRQALYVRDNEIVDDASVKQVIRGGSYDEKCAKGITITSDAPHFNGIYITGNTKYSIEDSSFYAYGNGGDDLNGWGVEVSADGDSELEVKNCCMKTVGAIRSAMYIGDQAKATVTDSVLYSVEPQTGYEDYTNLTPAMMKRVPFALGMEGSVRTINVMGAGQAKYRDSIIVSTGWGALSDDSGTAYDICHTHALDVENCLSGIGTLEVAQEGKTYTAVKEVNGVKYGFTVGGSGYVTFADSGILNLYKNCDFYAPDYIEVLASSKASSTFTDSYLYSEHTAFMTQQAGGGTLTLEGCTVDTVDGLMQIKSGAANTGYTNMVVDNSRINFSGKSTRSDAGILCELIESDDAGNPGITTYTICDYPEEVKPTGSTVKDSLAAFKNGSYVGDIWNSIYNYRQILNVTLENARLTGKISASTAVHVDLEGNLVPNGTRLDAYLGSKEYDCADYRDEKGGTSGQYVLIGRFRHTAAPVINNPIVVTIDADSDWTVTGDSYLQSLTVTSLEQIRADAAVTVTTKALCVGGEVYADGTYTCGNVTIAVDSTEAVVEDNGIADAGQTYGNTVYTFYSRTENGEFDSKAFTVKRQNYIDGNLYFTLIPAEGRKIISFEAVGGELSENHAEGEIGAYEYVMAPVIGGKEMAINVVVNNQ